MGDPFITPAAEARYIPSFWLFRNPRAPAEFIRSCYGNDKINIASKLKTPSNSVDQDVGRQGQVKGTQVEPER